MPVPEVSRLLTAQEVFNNTFEQAGNAAEAVANYKVPHVYDVRNTNLYYNEATYIDEVARVDTISAHVSLAGFHSERLLSVTRRHPYKGWWTHEGQPVSAGAWRGHEPEKPDYFIKHDPNNGLIVCTLGRSGLEEAAEAQEEVYGETTAKTDQMIDELGPDDQARIDLVVDMITKRADMVREVIERAKGLNVRKAIYTPNGVQVEDYPTLRL